MKNEIDKTIRKTVVFESKGRRAQYYADDGAVFLETGAIGTKAADRIYLEPDDIDFLRHVFKETGL
jgi:hypothetical protein